MDDSKLRAVLTAVQCGSFGKAAAQLGYTQSAMTHLVNKLEAELDCTLLVRSSHGVRLSEEGEHLLPYINQVISACDALRSEAEVQGELYGRALTIGCFASIARARLPDLLSKFRKLHPEIKVDVLVQGNELADALEQDKIQLAIVDEACGHRFHWTPLLPPDTPRLTVTASDDGAILSMVAGGLGVSVLSAFSLAGYEGRVRVIPLDKPVSRRLGVAVKTLPAANTAARVFLSFLKRQYNGGLPQNA